MPFDIRLTVYIFGSDAGLRGQSVSCDYVIQCSAVRLDLNNQLDGTAVSYIMWY